MFEALPKGITLAEVDLEPLLLELPECLSEKFRRKTLWLRLSTDAEVAEEKTAESLAVLRLATTVLGNSVRFVVLDSVGEIQDYERMGVIADLQHLTLEPVTDLGLEQVMPGETIADVPADTPENNLDTDDDEIKLYGIMFESAGGTFYRAESVTDPEVKAGDPEVEAGIILIVHPDSRRLGSRFHLSPGTSLEIGRSATTTISFPEVPSVSYTHARLRYFGHRVTIEDLGSTNGTYVNGRRITGQAPLQSGDRFQTAAVHFKFLHERDPEHAYHEVIYDLVMRDGLTEIYNKRKYDEELQREFARAMRHRRPLSLIAFDIDEFKQVNDTYGHLGGDFVLKQLASLVREVLRPEQIFARVGGDEFAILAPETELEGAETLAKKLCERVLELDYRYEDYKIEVSCSFGVAEIAPDMALPLDLCHAADSALSHAKRSGVSQVAVTRNASRRQPQ
jgi:diguanylate cyclase (GGDEF)-like protein